MGNKLFSALLCCVYVVVLPTRAEPGGAQRPISPRSVTNRNPIPEQSSEEIPLYSVSQYLPCLGQAKTFSELSNSFSAGHLPSQSDLTGSWVLIGSWLHKDSYPDLNCTGITRNKIYEWVMRAQGYSLGIDIAGTYQTSALKLGRKHDLTIAMDLGGDASPVLRCRLTRRHNLVCLGDTYYSGLEFRKTPVHCEPPVPNTDAPVQLMPCYPNKKELPSSQK